MKENFAKSLAFVLEDEGGNDDDPSDHGGRTSRGITQREYNAWRKERGLPQRDVWIAHPSEIETIYHDEYWLPYCDGLPAGTDYCFFDMAVNAGPHRAAVLLQRALGVAADGRIGPITRKAARQVRDFRNLIDKFTDRKRDFYIGLHQPKFTRGWLNRCRHVRNNALTMVGN